MKHVTYATDTDAELFDGVLADVRQALKEKDAEIARLVQYADEQHAQCAVLRAEVTRLEKLLAAELRSDN